MKVAVVSARFPSRFHALDGIFVEEQTGTLGRVHNMAVAAPYCMTWKQALRGHWPARRWSEQRLGVPVFRQRCVYPFPKYPSWCWDRHVVAGTLCAAERLFREWGKPELLHAHVTFPAGVAAVELKRRYGIPVLITEHYTGFSSQLTRPSRSSMVRHALQQCDAIVAMRQRLAEQVRAVVPHRQVGVTENLIRTGFFVPDGRPRPAGRPVRFLCVGIVSQRKGIHYLLEAAQLLQSQGRAGFEIIVGGDGPEREPLEQEARRLGIQERCQFLGALNREQVRDAMQACDVFVVASLAETFDLEAAACGKPVIVTRSGGPEDTTPPEVGIVVNPADPTALAEAMSVFLSGGFHADSARIREHMVQYFGEEAFVARMTRLYQETCEAASRVSKREQRIPSGDQSG